MEYTTTNAFFLRDILQIGGIESHFWYMARKYGKYDITIFYYYGNPAQIERLRKLVRCVKLTSSDKVVCTNMFCCFNRDVLAQTEAETIYLVLHGDYLDMVDRGQLDRRLIPMDKRVDKYLGVSHHVCETWEKLTGIHAEFIGEPVDLPKEDRPLMLISATRLTAEKGWERMKILANAMNGAGIKYLWTVFTNSKPEEQIPNMSLVQPTMYITDILSIYDAYVQLSDNEGFCLSVVEALLRGVPVIGTDLPVFRELGLDESNSVILDLDMKSIPIERIREIRELEFTYKAPKDNWIKYLSRKKSDYRYTEYKIRATDGWIRFPLTDAYRNNHMPQPGEVWTVLPERLDEIQNFEKAHGVKLVEVVK